VAERVVGELLEAECQGWVTMSGNDTRGHCDLTFWWLVALCDLMDYSTSV